MPALLGGDQFEALILTPAKILGGVALSPLANLHHPVAIQQTFLHRPTESGAMSDFLAEHVVVGVGVGINMNQSNRAVLFGERPQNRQRDRVVTTHGERNQVVVVEAGVVFFDQLDRFQQAVGIDGDITDIRHRQRIKRRSTGGHVVRTDHHGLIANPARAIAGARTL